MIPRQGAHHFFLVVQHRIAAVAALQHHLPHVVYVVVQMEGDQPLRGAGTVNGRGLIDQPVHTAGVQRRGDDARLSRVLQPRRVHIRLAQDQAGYLLVQCPAYHVRLAAAQHDAVVVVEQQVFTVLGQRDGHGAADAVHHVAAVAHDPPLDNAQQVEQGDLIHPRVAHGVQAEGGDVAGGQHPVERPVLLDHGDGGDLLLPHELPCPIHRHGRVQTGGTVKVQIPHLCADVLDEARRLELEPLQHPVRLVADGAHVHRRVFLLAQRVFQRGIGHGGHDGVGVRIPVPDHIDLVHTHVLLCAKITLTPSPPRRACRRGR